MPAGRPGGNRLLGKALDPVHCLDQPAEVAPAPVLSLSRDPESRGRRALERLTGPAL